MFAFKKFNHSGANTPTPGYHQWLMKAQCPYSDYSKYYLYSTVVLALKCYHLVSPIVISNAGRILPHTCKDCKIIELPTVKLMNCKYGIF